MFDSKETTDRDFTQLCKVIQSGTHDRVFIRIMLVNISPDVSSSVREIATPA